MSIVTQIYRLRPVKTIANPQDGLKSKTLGASAAQLLQCCPTDSRRRIHP